MGNKRGIIIAIFCVFLFWNSCDFSDDLSTEIAPSEPTFFIECYLKPGGLYNLTATEVQPIFEDYILDYSLDFDIFIIDEDSIELLRSLFFDSETGLVYNYGGARQLDNLTEEISLFAITPSEDTITAFSLVPEQVVMESAEHLGSLITASFQLSSDINQNFYIAIVNYQYFEENENGDQIVVSDFDIKYLELGNIDAENVYELRFENESYIDSPRLKLTLMRVTEENYNYQLSLENAKNASTDNITYPSPLEGNLVGGVGIFTAYTEAVVEF